MAKAGAPCRPSHQSQQPAHLLNPLEPLNPDTPAPRLVSIIDSTPTIGPDQAGSGAAENPDEAEPSNLVPPRSPPARRIAGRRLHTRATPASRPRSPSPPAESEPDPEDPEPWSLASRLHSHTAASPSRHSPRPNPRPDPSPPANPAVYPILTVNSAASGDNAQKLLTITTCVNECKATLLIDSGASRDFLSTRFVKIHRLRTSPLPSTLRIRLADGTLNATATELPDALIQLTPDYSYETSFIVTHLSGYDGILGKPFLTRVNPVIDWSSNSITSPFSLNGDALPEPTLRIQLITAKKMAKLLWKHRELDAFQLYLNPASPDPSPDPDPEPEPKPPDPFAPSTVLSAERELELHRLLQDTHRPVFDEPDKVTHAGPLQRIHLKDGSTPPQQRMYRMSPAELEELKKQLNTYLDKGWIRPSTSEFGAPILFARKADGSLRLCVDYRALNAITLKDRGPLPRMDELFDHLHGARYFTSLDLWSGYHQCRIHPDDVHKTAFMTRYGLYEFLVMPFGLTNAPAAFMRLMHTVLKPYLDKFVVVYLDDVLIYSKTEAEHIAHVNAVLSTLAQENLRVKITKCSFAQDSTTFLGYRVSSKGLSVDPKKVAAVSNWPLPHDITSTRSFLGFTAFYRRFIPNYATLAAPLTDLTKTTVPFPATLPQPALDAFRNLQSALLSATVLAIPFTGPTATFILYTDASTVGIGAVLLQDQGNGPQPVCYESRKLSPAERGYAVHELEMLAVVHAVKVFRHYLEGCQHFTLYTDHHSLKYFFTQRDLSRRQARWAQDLAPYQPNMTITYKKGPENQADALSRIPHLSHLQTPSPVLNTLLCQLADLLPAHIALSDSILDDIKAAYASDPYYAPDAKRPSYIKRQSDNFWYFNSRICIPANPDLRRRLLYEFHDTPTSGHPGYMKTLNAVATHFWWPRMTRTIRAYVSSCATCQRIKSSTQPTPGLLQPHAIPSRPWSHVSLDLITDLPKSQAPDGHTYDSIATFVDMLTKQAFFVRTNKTISSTQFAHLFLDHVISKRGLPSVLVSDRDPRITSEFWQTLFTALGSKLNMSTAHHPQTDGQTEVTHRTIEQILRAYVSPQQDDWSAWLPVAEFAYNNSISAATRQTPFYANFGYHPTAPPSLLNPPADPDAARYLEALRDVQLTITRELELAKAQATEQANRHRRPLTFNIGDRVRLSSDFLTLADYPSSKLRPRYLGPFTVTAIVSPVSYRLALPESMKLHPVFHVSRLLPWHASDDAEFPGRSTPDQPIRSARDYIHGDAYVVDKLLDVKIDKNPASRSRPPATCLLFKVKWAAPYHADEHDSWEPLSALTRLDALRDFLSSSAWQRFAASDAYKRWASKPANKRKLPKVVTFAFDV